MKWMDPKRIVSDRRFGNLFVILTKINPFNNIYPVNNHYFIILVPFWHWEGLRNDF